MSRVRSVSEPLVSLPAQGRSMDKLQHAHGAGGHLALQVAQCWWRESVSGVEAAQTSGEDSRSSTKQQSFAGEQRCWFGGRKGQMLTGFPKHLQQSLLFIKRLMMAKVSLGSSLS